MMQFVGSLGTDVGSTVPTAASTAALSKQGGRRVWPCLSHSTRMTLLQRMPWVEAHETSLLSFLAQLPTVGMRLQTPLFSDVQRCLLPFAPLT